MLTSDEMKNFTKQCQYQDYSSIEPGGNLINSRSSWNLTGSLIKKMDIPSEDIICTAGRNVVVPIRYRTLEDAVGVCEALGKKGDYLAPFTTFNQYKKFYHNYKSNPAINKYCSHGGRFILWLPYHGWTDLNDVKDIKDVNITFYNSNHQLSMMNVWRSKKPKMKNNERPYCVIARIGYDVNVSWLDSTCDTWDSYYGWDRAPCSACTLLNHVSQNNEFRLRGLCDRSGFDTSFMVINDEKNGMITYIGERNTIIKYDDILYQWNMTVTNNPSMSAVSHSEMSSLVIGKHTWHVSGDTGCNSKPYSVILSLSSCNSSQFTCGGGVCIKMEQRCDNINDCRDRSDEADCTRVSRDSTYQKFIVPPPVSDNDKTEVNISINISKLKDIRFEKYLNSLCKQFLSVRLEGIFKFNLFYQ